MITDLGLCCVFNSENALKKSNFTKLVKQMRETTEYKNKETTDMIKIPAAAGKTNGITLTLDLHSNYVSFGTLSQDFSAFRIFVGQQSEFPAVKEYGHLIQPGHEHFLSLSTQISTASGIDSLSPEDRQCYFPNEGYLEFYEKYSKTVYLNAVS